MSGPLGTLGRYEILRRLGRGGMAETFEGRALGAAGVVKPVCVKRILPEYARDRRFVKMFVDEARVSMALHHGNIAQVFDFGQDGGSLFLAMELVDGQSLHRCRVRLLRQGWAFPVPMALQVTHEVCRALQHAHQLTDRAGRPLGIVHRDVSPPNILLSYEGQVKLVDFGIARAAAVAEVGSGVKGKLPYMAPEQARREEIDARADVFGIGATLFELLTGRTPVTGSAPKLLRSLADGAVPRVRDVAPGVDPELAAVVDMALEPDPAARFPSALAFQEALAAYAHDRGLRPSEDEVGAMVRYLFSEELAEEGRSVDLPADFPAVLDPWKLDAPVAPATDGRLRTGLLAAGAALVLIGGIALGLWLGRGPATDTLQVRSRPSGARVLVDGRDTGVVTDGVVTGLDLDRPHQVDFRLDGFHPVSRSVLPGQDTVAVVLELAAAAPADEAPGAGVAKPVPEAEVTAPVTVDARADGSFLFVVDLAQAQVSTGQLGAAWLEVPPDGPATLAVNGEVSVVLTRNLQTAAWVAVGADEVVVGSGLVRSSEPVALPRSTARVGVFVPEAGSCKNNSGELIARVRRRRKVLGERRVVGAANCFSSESAVRNTAEGLSTQRGYRVRRLDTSGPTVLLIFRSGAVFSLAETADTLLWAMGPGEEVVVNFVSRTQFVVVEPLGEATEARFEVTPGPEGEALPR